MGARIEIQQKNAKRMQAQSLLSWERGLKYQDSEELHPAKKSLLSWERGLKYQDSEELHSAKTSLLSWERGLKY